MFIFLSVVDAVSAGDVAVDDKTEEVAVCMESAEGAVGAESEEDGAVDTDAGVEMAGDVDDVSLSADIFTC